jgi:hypothetical protein
MSENAPGGVLNLIVRTADQTRKNGIEIDPQNRCGEIIEAAVRNWSLPVDTDYTLINVTRENAQLNPLHTLAQAGVMEGDTLEIQPVLVAG